MKKIIMDRISMWKEIFKVLAIIFTIIFLFSFTYTLGHGDGFNKGADQAFDTVIAIMGEQADSDTSVTLITLETPKDTATFILSANTIK